MPEVTIGGNAYFSYASLAEANAYLEAAVQAATWRDPETTDDDRGRALVTMTRIIDRQSWLGTPLDEYDPHAFPRAGLFDRNGDPVDPGSVPIEVVQATIEGANALLDGGEFQTQPTTENVTKRLKAGSVELEFFRGAGGVPTRFPLIIMELLGLWLAASGGSGLTDGIDAFGTDGRSKNTGDEFTLVEGL